MFGARIRRDAIVENLELQLRKAEDVVVLCGLPGSGKSAVLRDLADVLGDRAALLTTSPREGFAVDPLSAAEQLDGIIRRLPGGVGDTLSASESDPRASLHSLVRAFAKYNRARGHVGVLVVDGVDECQDEHLSRALALTQSIPVGTLGLKVVFAATQHSAFEAHLLGAHGASDVRVGRLSVKEVAQLLEGYGLRVEHAKVVHRATDGLIASVVLVSELLARGGDVERLAATAVRGHDALVLEAWPQDELASRALEFLAVAARPYSSAELSLLCGADADLVAACLSASLLVRPLPDSRWTIRDTATLRSAQVIAAPREAVLAEGMLSLSANAEGPLSANDVGLMARSGRHTDLLAALSTRTVSRMATDAPSTAAFFETMRLGLSASASLRSTAETARLATQAAIAATQFAGSAQLAEARTRAAFGDISFALHMATSSTRPEIRLQYLSIALRARAERGLPRDPDLHADALAMIAALPQRLDHAIRHDIAGTLFRYDPALALASLEAAAGSDGAHSLDWDFAQLALAALARSSDEARLFSRSEAPSRITDADALTVGLAVGALAAPQSAEEVIAAAKRLPTTVLRMFLLRHWMLAHREREDAINILVFGLDDALSARDFSLTAALVRQLALCLPYTAQIHTSSHLIRQIDSQRQLLRSNSPIEEYVRLQALLARAEWRFDRSLAVSRLDEVAQEIDAEQAPESSLVGFSRLLSACRMLEDAGSVPEVTALEALAREALMRSAETVISETALHTDRLADAVRALAPAAFDDALALCARANVQSRRDELRALLCTEAIQYRAFAEAPRRLAAAVAGIADEYVRADCVLTILRTLRGRSSAMPSTSDIKWLKSAVESFPRWNLRSAGAVELCILAKRVGASDLVAEIRVGLLECWRHADDGWFQLEHEFAMIALCAEPLPELAAELAVLAEDLKQGLQLHSRDYGIAVFRTLSLTCRLLPAFKRDPAALRAVIRRVRSAAGTLGRRASQAAMLVDLYIRARDADDSASAQEIVTQDLVPLLSTATDSTEREELLEVVGPALASGAFATLSMHLSRASEYCRGRVAIAASRHLLYGIAPGDPLDTDGVSKDITFENCCTIIKLSEQCGEDASVYFTL